MSATTKHDKERAKLRRMSSFSASLDYDNEDEALYKEIFFIENGSQSNIYCNTTIRYPSETQERFLVGTLNGNVSCLERFKDLTAKEKFHSSHSMDAREVNFAYIPGIILLLRFLKDPTTPEDAWLKYVAQIFPGLLWALSSQPKSIY